jgi:hypothetical protein
MRRFIISAVLSLCAALALSGCIGLSLGGGTKTVQDKPTLGQQLVDLQKAKECGAITEAEFNAQKQKLLAK